MNLRGLVGWLALVLVFLVPSLAGSEPPPRSTLRPLLWQVGSKPPSFLYGTVHVPDRRVLALPGSVVRALADADVVYTEVPMDQRTRDRIQRASMLPRGQTLASVLPQPVYDRTARYLRSRGFSIQPFYQQKVWALQVALELLDYLPEMAETQPLDMYLAERARTSGKRMAALETVDEQLQVLDGMSVPEQIEVLEESLALLETAAETGELSPARRLVDSYLRGDAEKLRSTALAMVDTTKPLNRRQLDLLIDKRNAVMADRILEALRKTPDESHFFAVGALHYPGEKGIVALLRAQGLEVEQVE
jgi:uncharacterized protein